MSALLRPQVALQIGRIHTDNLAMVILGGIRWQTNGSGVRKGFAGRNTDDQQIATLGTYLTLHYGNPAATVSVEQVKMLRTGGAPSHLVLIARLALILVVLVLVAIIVMLVRRK